MNLFSRIMVFVGGIAAGWVYGMLYAPNKGSVTKKKVFQSSKNITREGKNAIEELKSKFIQHVHTGNGHHK